ncbi:hypothetical protein ACROYT_G043139 [Oculina patagonica]
MAINILVIFLTLVSATKAKDNEIITSLIQAYSVAGAESKSYFRSHGKALLQQVSMLDSMALAKLGKDLEATDQLASLAVQTILADLPVEYQAAGGLMKLMQSDRPFFRNTVITAQRNLDKVSQGIKKKLAEFKNSNTKTDEDKQRVQEAIKASVSGQENARRNIFNAWKADLRELQQLAEAGKPSPKAVRAWHVYGKAKFFIKRIKFPPKYRVGPWSDILGIVVSGINLHNAIKNKNSLGMVNSVLGIVGSVVGLTLFTSALVTGLEILSTLNALAGAAFFMLPLIVKLFWPSNLAIDTANKLTEISRNDLDGYLHQLGQFSESGARRKYGRSRGQLVGNYQRNVEIDTRTVPQYNDVDLDQWSAKYQTVKREREPSQRDEAQEIECAPESDRISIDELSLLNPHNGRVTINTGALKQIPINIHSFCMLLRTNEVNVKLHVGATNNANKHQQKSLHDAVIMGAQGPFTVIQNRGANDYILNMVDIMTSRTPGQPIRFEIMDTSGNLPFIRICQSRHKRVTIETKENDVIKLKASDGEVVVEIRVTGYAPDVDIRSECA